MAHQPPLNEENNDDKVMPLTWCPSTQFRGSHIILSFERKEKNKKKGTTNKAGGANTLKG